MERVQALRVDQRDVDGTGALDGSSGPLSSPVPSLQDLGMGPALDWATVSGSGLRDSQSFLGQGSEKWPRTTL